MHSTQEQAPPAHSASSSLSTTVVTTENVNSSGKGFTISQEHIIIIGASAGSIILILIFIVAVLCCIKSRHKEPRPDCVEEHRGHIVHENLLQSNIGNVGEHAIAERQQQTPPCGSDQAFSGITTRDVCVVIQQDGRTGVKREANLVKGSQHVCIDVQQHGAFDREQHAELKERNQNLGVDLKQEGHIDGIHGFKFNDKTTNKQKRLQPVKRPVSERFKCRKPLKPNQSITTDATSSEISQENEITKPPIPGKTYDYVNLQQNYNLKPAFPDKIDRNLQVKFQQNNTTKPTLPKKIDKNLVCQLEQSDIQKPALPDKVDRNLTGKLQPFDTSNPALTVKNDRNLADRLRPNNTSEDSRSHTDVWNSVGSVETEASRKFLPNKHGNIATNEIIQQTKLEQNKLNKSFTYTVDENVIFNPPLKGNFKCPLSENIQEQNSLKLLTPKILKGNLNTTPQEPNSLQPFVQRNLQENLSKNIQEQRLLESFLTSSANRKQALKPSANIEINKNFLDRRGQPAVEALLPQQNNAAARYPNNRSVSKDASGATQQWSCDQNIVLDQSSEINTSAKRVPPKGDDTNVRDQNLRYINPSSQFLHLSDKCLHTNDYNLYTNEQPRVNSSYVRLYDVSDTEYSPMFLNNVPSTKAGKRLSRGKQKALKAQVRTTYVNLAKSNSGLIRDYLNEQTYSGGTDDTLYCYPDDGSSRVTHKAVYMDLNDAETDAELLRVRLDRDFPAAPVYADASSLVRCTHDVSYFCDNCVHYYSVPKLFGEQNYAD